MRRASRIRFLEITHGVTIIIITVSVDANNAINCSKNNINDNNSVRMRSVMAVKLTLQIKVWASLARYRYTAVHFSPRLFPLPVMVVNPTRRYQASAGIATCGQTSSQSRCIRGCHQKGTGSSSAGNQIKSCSIRSDAPREEHKI